jgi:hypothetical protein
MPHAYLPVTIIGQPMVVHVICVSDLIASKRTTLVVKNGAKVRVHAIRVTVGLFSGIENPKFLLFSITCRPKHPILNRKVLDTIEL